MIPAPFLPAIEKGIRQALEEGFIASYPLQDLKVTVFDGKFHAVDSKEIAFVAAGKKAFQIALENAHPVVLEPMVELRVEAQGEAMGDITADLSSRRGRISNTGTASNGHLIISGLAPLAELDDYSSRLKSITGGKGSYKIIFSHYAPVPGNIQQQLAKKHQQAIHGGN